jgi:cholesterol transport system auxiliary component
VTKSSGTVLAGKRRPAGRGLRALLFCTAALVPLALSGCGGLFHSNARPDQVYYLRATAFEKGSAAADPLAASLRVIRPTAAPGLDSPQIVLLQSDRRMSFYLASRWPASAPNMVESLAVEKLRGSGMWQSVGDSTSSFPSDYVIQVMIRRFEADYTSGGPAPDIHVVFDCVVGRREGREVVASFLAEGSAQAGANRLGAVVAAFETATNTALDSMAMKTAGAVRLALASKR